MKKIIQCLKIYLIETDKRIFLLSVFFIAVSIFINYSTGLEKKLRTLNELPQYLSWLCIFLCSFSFPYLLHWLFNKKKFFKKKKFVFLLLLAPVLFAWKISGNIYFHFTHNETENNFWNLVVYWPIKLTIISLSLYGIWKLFDKDQGLYGLNTKDFDVKPYVVMLVIMMPLVSLAATQTDFLRIYPKLKNIGFLTGTNKGWYQLLYELSYGSDFFTIEFFFRGFLILAFTKWAGKDAILPMALFYCTIHFGKPLGECISSFFGGIILGVITYHTRTIYGGLMVHLGIAWLMELAGYVNS